MLSWQARHSLLVLGERVEKSVEFVIGTCVTTKLAISEKQEDLSRFPPNQGTFRNPQCHSKKKTLLLKLNSFVDRRVVTH